MDGEADSPRRSGFVLDDITSVTLQTALSALSQQQRTTANNIANIDTPGFQASRVSFEDSLRAAVASGSPGSAQVTTAGTGETPGQNGNNVSLSEEMVIATKSSMQYQLMSTAVSAKFDLISDSIRG
jgi:flagellar basal-body rod protein FlgB